MAATAPRPISIPSHKAQREFLDITQTYGMYTGQALDSLKGKTAEPDLVAGWLPVRSVNILIGDSGVGKTPLAYQLGLCVAAGLPFLGAATRRGRVLILDFENGARDWHRMLDQQRKFLGLANFPSPNLIFWPVHSAIP